MTFKKTLIALLIFVFSVILIACDEEFIDNRDDYQKVLDLVNVYYENTGDNANNVTGNLILPTNIETNVAYDSIAWSTSLPNVIDANGKVTRQTEDVGVKLAVTVVIGGIGREKIFEVVVIAKDSSEVYWTVNFDSLGGTLVPSQSIIDNDKVTRPTDPTLDGYTFAGWFVGEAEYDFNSLVISDLTITAKWEVIVVDNTYTVTFNTHGGSTIESKIVYENTLVSVTNPARGNDTFVGWYRDYELKEPWNINSDRVNDNITLYARWEMAEVALIAGRTLLFNDEFNGDSLDLTKWDFQNGTGHEYGLWGWGNDERQYYKPDNIEVSNGTLKIYAKIEQTYDSGSNRTLNYSSSKIVTLGRHSQTFGRIETRLKAPIGDGFWPAFWMMPVNNTYGNGWPFNGEIDIMELRGRQPQRITSAMHFRETWGHHYLHGEAMLPSGQSIEQFHVYGVEWTNGRLEFFVDGNVYHTRTSNQWNNWYDDKNAPFNHEFFIILNLAIGGSFDGGRLPSSSDFPASLEVDYVRAYAPL